MQRKTIKVNSRNIKEILGNLIRHGADMGLVYADGSPNIDAMATELSDSELDSLASLIDLDFEELQQEIKAESDEIAAISDRDPVVREIFATDYTFSSKFVAPKIPLDYRKYYGGDYEAVQEDRASWGFREIIGATESLDIVTDGGKYGAEREQAEENAVTSFQQRMKKKPVKTAAEKLVSSTIDVRADLQAVKNMQATLTRNMDKTGAVGSLFGTFVHSLMQLEKSIPAAKEARQSYSHIEKSIPAAKEAPQSYSHQKSGWENAKAFGRYLWQQAKQNKKKILFWMGVGVVLTVATVLTFGLAGAVAGAGFATVGATFGAAGGSGVAAGVAASVVYGATGGAVIAYGTYTIGKGIKHQIDARLDARGRDDDYQRLLGQYQVDDVSPPSSPKSETKASEQTPMKQVTVSVEDEKRDDQTTVYKPLYSPTAKPASPASDAKQAEPEQKSFFERHFGRFRH